MRRDQHDGGLTVFVGQGQSAEFGADKILVG